MGKTAAGAVWLNADRLSPYDYWQFWRNTEDADVGRFLKLFTDLPLDEIATAGGAARRGDQRRQEGARQRGHRPDARAHAAAETAAATAQAAFVEGKASGDLPTIHVKGPITGTNVTAELVTAAFVASKSEVRRLAQQGGLKINDKAEGDP